MASWDRPSEDDGVERPKTPEQRAREADAAWERGRYGPDGSDRADIAARAAKDPGRWERDSEPPNEAEAAEVARLQAERAARRDGSDAEAPPSAEANVGEHQERTPDIGAADAADAGAADAGDDSGLVAQAEAASAEVVGTEAGDAGPDDAGEADGGEVAGEQVEAARVERGQGVESGPVDLPPPTDEPTETAGETDAGADGAEPVQQRSDGTPPLASVAGHGDAAGATATTSESQEFVLPPEMVQILENPQRYELEQYAEQMGPVVAKAIERWEAGGSAGVGVSGFEVDGQRIELFIDGERFEEVYPQVDPATLVEHRDDGYEQTWQYRQMAASHGDTSVGQVELTGNELAEHDENKSMEDRALRRTVRSYDDIAEIAEKTAQRATDGLRPPGPTGEHVGHPSDVPQVVAIKHADAGRASVTLATIAMMAWAVKHTREAQRREN